MAEKMGTLPGLQHPCCLKANVTAHINSPVLTKVGGKSRDLQEANLDEVEIPHSVRECASKNKNKTKFLLLTHTKSKISDLNMSSESFKLIREKHGEDQLRMYVSVVQPL